MANADWLVAPLRILAGYFDFRLCGFG